MKKSILYIPLLFVATSASAQDSTSLNAMPAASSGVQFKALKNNDQVLPKWSLDVIYRYGSLKQDIEMINLADAYSQSLNNNFSKAEFSKGNTHSASLQLGYFFGKNRRFGIGTGISWQQQKGIITVKDFKTQYESTDRNNETFRQILTNREPITEEVTTTNFVIPVLLKFKHQFKNSNFGISIDAGALIGISNNNKYDAKARFDYEAAYLYDGEGQPIYDNDPNFNSNSQLITRQFWQDESHSTSDPSVKAYFDRKRNEGLNVALDTLMRNQGSTNYSKSTSLGFIFQPSITYYLSYNTTFLLGGYYTYQVYKNEGNQNYRLTDKIGDYNSITTGTKSNTVSSWGLSIGFRFFFGEKRDVDGDEVIDKLDECPLKAGDIAFKGCPDYDKDGIKDDIDDCPFDYGSETANGCPDRDGDGIADSKDACPDEPGVRVDDPALNGCPWAKIIKEQAKKNNLNVSEIPTKDVTLETYYDVLKTDVIYFDFGKTEILPSNFLVLDEAAAILQKNDKIMILVSGNTDSIGSYTNNILLSLNRAKAVSDYLQNKGVSKDRIIAAGNGYEKPITNNDKPENRALNRRTEMKLLMPLPEKK